MQQRAVAFGVGVCLLALVLPAARAAADEPAATPYRPTVAGGAALSRPGWIEVELGAQRLGGSRTERRDSLPVLVKLAFDEQWAVLLGGDAQLRQSPAGSSAVRGAGDSVLTLKYRLPDGGTPDTAFGAED